MNVLNVTSLEGTTKIVEPFFVASSLDKFPVLLIRTAVEKSEMSTYCDVYAYC
jgi:hypothetical protein